MANDINLLSHPNQHAAQGAYLSGKDTVELDGELFTLRGFSRRVGWEDAEGNHHSMEQHWIAVVAADTGFPRAVIERDGEGSNSKLRHKEVT